MHKEARHPPPVTAPLYRLQELCIATPGLLAQPLTQRFVLHLPYYRIKQMYGRAGVPLTRQTLKLSIYLRDGRAQIYNNGIENAIRPNAIGKKNWLFMGTQKSGDRAAVFYTLMGNCHREGINTESYLSDLFTRLPTETNRTVHRFTPKAWAVEQRVPIQLQAKTCAASM